MWVQTQHPDGTVTNMPLKPTDIVSEFLTVDEGCSSVLCVSGNPREVEISGSALDDINGRYLLTAERKGNRPVWQHTEAPRTKIQFSTMSRHWMIDWTDGPAPYRPKAIIDENYWLGYPLGTAKGLPVASEWEAYQVAEATCKLQLRVVAPCPEVAWGC